MSRTLGSRSRASDEKLTACLQEIKTKLAKGYTLGRQGSAKGKDRNIVVSDILRSYQLNTHLSGFLMAFDFRRRISLDRVAKERDAYCTHQSEMRRYREARRPRPEAVHVEREAPVAGGAVLEDWHLLGAQGVELVWKMGERRLEVTVHRLRPQVYAYEDRALPDGKHYVKRTWLAGDFKGGQMTAPAMVRILREARKELEGRIAGVLLQPLQASLDRFKFLMR